MPSEGTESDSAKPEQATAPVAIVAESSALNEVK